MFDSVMNYLIFSLDQKCFLKIYGRDIIICKKLVPTGKALSK